MSIESKIENLTAAVLKLASILENTTVSLPVPQVQQPAPQAPVTMTAPSPAPQASVAAPAPSMPAPPSFAPPVPAPVPMSPAAPFTDLNGLTAYVTQAFHSLGAKGYEIQNVMQSLGYQNINEIKPEHYGQLYAGIEALKA